MKSRWSSLRTFTSVRNVSQHNRLRASFLHPKRSAVSKPLLFQRSTRFTTRSTVVSITQTIRIMEFDRTLKSMKTSGEIKGEGDEEDIWEKYSKEHPLQGVQLMRERYRYSEASSTNFEDVPLTFCPKVERKVLNNKFSYILTPNSTPDGRVEAYLEVHAGSIDEEESQRGIAHVLEHCVFLGTEKYRTAEKMRQVLAEWGLSFGGDANAFTEFNHTVYTLHLPITNQDEESLYNALVFLEELAFKALLVEEQVQAEKGAVLAELNSSNTIEYRTEVNKFALIHGNNLLSQRFPIGKEEQIKKFTAEDLRTFYKKYYRIDNMTLHLVGTFNREAAHRFITSIFGKYEAPLTPIVRPHVESLSPPVDIVHIFSHELVTQVTFNLHSKYPVQKISTLHDIRTDVIYSIIALTLESRIYSIEQKESDPPFTNISWEFTDSYRERCTVSEIIVSSEPSTWKEALQVALSEIRKLIKYGITNSELREHLGTLLKDSHSEAEQNETLNSSDLIEYIMDDVNLGNVFIDAKQEFLYQMKVAHTITVSDVNNTIKEMFSWINASFLKLPPTTSSIFVTCPSHIKKKRKKSIPFKITKEEIMRTIEEAITSEPENEMDIPEQ